MCIEKVESFRYAGKLYPNELEAVSAAIHEIGSRIIKDFASKPFDGLVTHRKDLTKLLARYDELTPPAKVKRKRKPTVPAAAVAVGADALSAVDRFFEKTPGEPKEAVHG